MPDTRRFIVVIPLATYDVVEVEAKDEEEALDLAMDNIEYDGTSGVITRAVMPEERLPDPLVKHANTMLDTPGVEPWA